MSVWPPGSNIYLGECVLLQCSVESNSSFVWRYRWLKHEPRAASLPTPNPRHLVSGDSYSITAVTREDAGSYQCQAERRESNITSVVLLSQPATLRVSGEQQLQPLQRGVGFLLYARINNTQEGRLRRELTSNVHICSYKHVLTWRWL